MNPRILLQIKSVYGVLGRDSMLVFDEGCIGSDLWMYEKEEKIPILQHFGLLVPVYFVFWPFLANVYRYTLFCISSFDQFSYFGHNLLISYPI